MQPVISNVCNCPVDSRESCMYMQVYGLHGGVVRSFSCHIHGVCVCNGLELIASPPWCGLQLESVLSSRSANHRQLIYLGFIAIMQSCGAGCAFKAHGC